MSGVSIPCAEHLNRDMQEQPLLPHGKLLHNVASTGGSEVELAPVGQNARGLAYTNLSLAESLAP